MTGIADPTLHAVSTEIGVTLSRARSALESYAETMVDPAPLVSAANAVHEVFGALRIVEIAGAALLAEEMEATARFLANAPVDQRNQPEGLDALMRSLVQLPGYLDRVMAGGRDVPLVLLPLLNDLRAVRGQALLSEGTLLLLNLSSDRQPEMGSSAEPAGRMPVAHWARRLRPKFQVALLGVLRGERLPQHLEVLAQIAERIERSARRQPVFQLWWVIGSVIEALQQGSSDGVATIKRLLGQADRELRRLTEIGEDRYAETPPVDLLNNLLYFVARTPADGERIQAVRESFRLRELLPVSSEVEDQRASLSAPSVKLMQTVGAAIREDIGRVKDALDLFVRGGGEPTSSLSDQVELLHKIGDTLGVLGLGNLRTVIQSQQAALSHIIATVAVPDRTILVDIAAALIRVEDSLESQLIGLIQPTVDQEGSGAAEVDDDHFPAVRAAVLRECMVNFAHVKEAVGAVMTGGESVLTAAIPDLIRGIVAGLSILGRERAVGIVRRIGDHLDRAFASASEGPAQRFDRIADAIVSLEYYIETLQSGRTEPAYMLDNAEACLRVLEHASITPNDRDAPSPAGASGPVSALEGKRPHGDAESIPQPGDTVSDPRASGGPEESGVFRAIPPAPQKRPEPATVHTAIADEVDPDLVQLFIEEAREEIDKIHGALALWTQNPLDDPALQSLRRSFHTLKGSGRMVGARLVGDFSWSVENLLNRLISGTRGRSAPVMDVLGAAVSGLPDLIDQLETRRLPTCDVAQLIARLHALAEGDEADPLAVAPTEDPAAGHDSPTTGDGTTAGAASWLVATSVVTLPAATESSEPAVAAAGSDAHGGLTAEAVEVTDSDSDSGEVACDRTLEEIYRSEVAAHVAILRAWSKAREGRQAPHAISEPLHRACHTLAGASRMAGMEVGIALAEPLNRWVREHEERGVGLPDSALALMLDVASAFERISASPPRLSADEIAGLSARLESLVGEHELLARQGQDEPTVGADLAVTGSFSVVDFDPEIAAIFSDEAGELLEALATAAHRLVRNARDSEAVTAVMRYLHTLKGGARMAGIAPMGELAHELEGLLTDADPTMPESVPQFIEAGVDALETMRAQVQRGSTVTPANDLVARLRVATRRAPNPPVLRDLAVEQPDPSSLPQPDVPSGGLPPRVNEIAQGALPPLPGTTIEVPSLLPDSESPGTAGIALPTALNEDGSGAATDADPLAAAGLREDRQESARVDPALLDSLLNSAGEVSIQRARLEQQLSGVDANLAELSRVVSRLREQLRKLEIETEAHILHRHDTDPGSGDFDPLELDRYSTLQQYSRALAESANDVASVQGIVEHQVREAQSLLTLQARVVTDLQNGLMRTRMVSFQRHIPRLSRIVRQAAVETGKSAELTVTGATGEADRQVLERMLAPFEHLLRNAVVHGIETPHHRAECGKPPVGRIELALRREGSEVVILVQDDGAGLDLPAIREKAQAMGLLQPRQSIPDLDAMQLILEPGFSTAAEVTASAGRGVGMDVVSNEVKRLGGSLQIDSTVGQGTRFTIRLPFTLAVSQALLLRSGTEFYALPLPTVESVVRLPKSTVQAHLAEEVPTWSYGGQVYAFQHLGRFIGGRPSDLPAQDVPVPVILIRAGDRSAAVVADELVGSREIVIKNVGPIVSSIRGIAGATILGDGRIVVILDLGALVRGDWRSRVYGVPDEPSVDNRTLALVVDDSITVRRVTQRLLERNGMRVLTARDGIDALAILQDHVPDVILLDIEMPRMDGYDLAARIRADERLRAVPVVMITSRVGEKHRARAIELGIDDYLGKPYQETQLLDAIEPLVTRGRVMR